jgi:glucose-1-phosphate thymidylyltransferase
MKALVMAAGYGTRLYPLTKDTPKPMLEVGDRPMIDHIVEKIESVDAVDELLLVTNEKFYERFLEWEDSRNFDWPVTILNDGTTEDGDKRGAIGDIHFTVQEASIQDDLLVLAGDNLFDFSLSDMASTFERVSDNVIGVLQFDDESKLSKYGIVDVDENDRVVDFVEKPDEPPSNLVAMGMYLFSGEKLSLIEQYLDEGGNPDEPGWYVTWLVENDEVYAHTFEGNWFDIGDKDSLEKADKFLQEHSIH